jgi:uncharacterized membrane protein
MIPIVILAIVCHFICKKNSNIVNVLSNEGNEEIEEWKALKNYMSDFSLLKDREVPDLILWEKYLVYATAFGIAKKVIEQLKTVYPEMMNDNYYDNRYAYMHFMCHYDMGSNFIDNLDYQVGKAYSSAITAYDIAHSSSSSGSGGGGGFSSGGGGRRRRWPVAVGVRIFEIKELLI